MNSFCKLFNESLFGFGTAPSGRYGPRSGAQMMIPIGAKDAFVIKLDTDGKLVWVKKFGGPGDTVPHANGLDIDKDNNVIICGGFYNTVDFDPGPNNSNLTPTAHIQTYVVKLNSSGGFI